MSPTSKRSPKCTATTMKCSCRWTSRSPMSNELSAHRFAIYSTRSKTTPRTASRILLLESRPATAVDRYGDGDHNDQIAKLMAVLELTTRGTPQMYYGEELGMRTTDPVRIEDVHDPIGKLGWPKEKGPMASARRCSGTHRQRPASPPQAKPWLPVPPSAATYNVDAEAKDPNSIFNTYQTPAHAAQNRPRTSRRHAGVCQRRRSQCLRIHPPIRKPQQS